MCCLAMQQVVITDCRGDTHTRVCWCADRQLNGLQLAGSYANALKLNPVFTYNQC